MPEKTRADDHTVSDGTIDRLVHEPARFTIMAQLYVIKSADFVFLLRRTGLTRGNLSSHMSKLENAGYLEVHKEFLDKMPRTLLKLTPRGREAFDAYRSQMRAMLNVLPE